MNDFLFFLLGVNFFLELLKLLNDFRQVLTEQFLLLVHIVKFGVNSFFFLDDGDGFVELLHFLDKASLVVMGSRAGLQLLSDLLDALWYELRGVPLLVDLFHKEVTLSCEVSILGLTSVNCVVNFALLFVQLVKTIEFALHFLRDELA